MAAKNRWEEYQEQKAAKQSGGQQTAGQQSETKKNRYEEYQEKNGKSQSRWTGGSTAEAVTTTIYDSVNLWLQDHNRYLNGYNSRYGNRKYSYEDDYVSDSGSWMDRVSEQKRVLDEGAGNILAYMMENAEYLDNDFYHSVRDTIQKARDDQGKILESFTQDHDYWNSFTPNEEQKASGLDTAEKVYKQWQAESKQYADDMAYDVEAATKELEELKASRDAYYAEKKAKQKQAESDESFWDSLGRWLGTTPDTTIPLAGASSATSAPVDTTANDFDKRISELETQINRAKYTQGYEGYMGNMNAQDYTQGSQYVSTRTGTAKEDAEYTLFDPVFGMPATAYHTDELFGDFLYDYINGNQEARDIGLQNNVATTDYFLGLDQNFLKNMTEDEVGVFNAIYKNQSPEAAYEFVKFISSDLEGRRRAQENAQWAAYAKESPVGASVFSTLISPLKGMSYLGQAADMLDDGKMDENAGYNRFSEIPSTIRSQVSTTIEQSGKWGKVGSFAYNTGMSMADFLWTTGVSGGNQAISLAIMGTGAAADATIAAKKRGLDDGQAFALGTVAGLAEVAMEKISLGAWLEGDMSEGALRYMLKNALSEGGEEAGTSAVNLLADIIIAGDKSEWMTAMQAYMEQGKSQAEAFGLVAAENAAQIGLDALGGFLSGTAIGGGTYATNSVAAAKQYKGTAKNPEKAKELVTESLQLNPQSQYAQKMQSKVEKGKNLTGMQVRNLLAANKEAITQNDMQKIQKAAQNRLTELGQKENVEQIAELATKWATGQDLSRSEKHTLASSTYGSRVANELFPDNIASGEFSTEWAEEIGTEIVNAKSYNKKIIEAVKAAIQQMPEVSTEYKALTERVGDEGRFAVAESGEAVIRESGAAVDLENFEVTKLEDGQLTIKPEGGEEVYAGDIDFATAEQSHAFSGVADMEGMTAPAATEMIKAIDLSKPVGAQLNGLDEAFTYGRSGYSFEQLQKRGKFIGDVTREQMTVAYELGKAVKESDTTNKADAIKKMHTAVEAAKQKAAAEGKAAPKARKMTITYNHGGGVIEDIKTAEKKLGKLHKEQRGGIEAAKILNQMGIGTDYELFASYYSKTLKDEDGNPLEVFLDDNGEEQPAYAGIYMAADGKIRINLNAYTGTRGLTLNALSHELTHFIENWSPEKYAVMADFLVKSYGEKGVAMHDLVLKEQARLKRVRGKDVSYNEAYHEVVANAFNRMLEDGKVMDRIAEIRKVDKSLGDKIIEAIRKFIKRFMKVYQENQSLFLETEALMEMKEVFEQLQGMFAEALVDASENFQAAQSIGFEMDAETESISPAVMQSEQTWRESDYVQQREQAAKEIAKAIGVSEKKAGDYIDSINSIAKMIAEDRSRLDYFSSPNRSSFVDNSEYGGSFDFSTLCKKRRLLTGTFTAIQKALPNTALTANEILDIRNRMKKANLEVSCGLCYVEGSRANMGQFAKEFLRLYKQYYPDAWQPNMADVNTPDGIEWVRINHPECYEQYEYFWNHYGTLKDGDKNLFASQQKPKLYQLHTEYKGEILNKFKNDDKVEDKNLNGGIRLQSFSDFEIVHLIDTMQIIMDMSRVGLAGQAYTKVPDFAWALGDTGLKINLSLIAKGVDENGKLIFDDVEGMPIEDAMKLRERYSKNVGTILVAFNDEQLKAAMADERVDFIIPFHRSQWKKSQYEAMGLPAKTKDYTFMQNEKFIKPQFHEYRGRMVKDKATNYMPNEYWDFSKSGKENAEAYLEMCARNNKRPKFYKLLTDNGDGSYSLKADGSTDGYWKLLIDFKMYDNDGNGSPQMAVKPDFNMEEATRMLESYKGGHSSFPVAQGVVDDFVKDYKDSHKGVQYSSQETDRYRQDYNAFREVLSKARLDSLSDKLGKLFPLSVGFEHAIQNDKTPVSNMTVVANSQNKAVGESYYTAGKNAFRNVYGGKTTFSIKQLGISAEADHSFARESMAKVSDTKDLQTILDLTPEFKRLIEESRLLAVERTIHNDNKKTSLLCYRLYNAYIRKEVSTDQSGNTQTSEVPHIVVFNVVQNLNDAKAHMVTDIKDVAVSNGHNSSKLKYATHANGNINIDNIADVYAVVKGVDRKNGGLRYSAEDNLKYKFDYTQKNTGERYSSQETDYITNRDLLANAYEGITQNSEEYKLIQEYKGRIKLINEYEDKLNDVNAQIREITFGTAGTRDSKKLQQLQKEAEELAGHISRNDRKLLNLEASAPLRRVIEIERKKASQKTREHINEIQQNKKMRAEQSELRYKIRNFKKKLEGKLLRPTDRQYVPVDLIGAMIDVCNLIDTDTSQYNPDGSLNKAQAKRDETKEKLRDLKDAYENLKSNTDPVYAGEFDENVYTYLTELRDKFSDKSLKEMTRDELAEMYEILVAIDETLADARKLIGWGDAETVYEAGDSIAAEQAEITQSRKNGKRSAAQKALDKIDNLGLSPVRNVERMSGYNQDSALLKLFKKFEQGIRKKNKFVMDAYKSFEALASGKEYDDAVYNEVDGKKYTDANGREFGVSKMQMMQAILSYERETANRMSHISKEGFSFADLDMLKKGKLRDAISEEYSHRVQAAYGMVSEFMEALKDDKWCQDYMAAARKFFNDTAKNAINETSIALKHRIIAKDKNYIPFEVDKNWVVREISAENDIQQTINSYGMLKDTVKGAPQPLIVTGLNNILDRHIDQVGNVYGLAIEVRNFNKVWNSKPEGVPIQTIIQRNWGVDGKKHIEQAVQDIQGPRVRDRNALYEKIKSNYIGATFLLNLSVVTKQIGSLFSATAMLKWRDPGRMIGNLVYTMANQKKIAAEVDKYTATAWMRRQGMSDAEVYTLMTQAKKPGLLRAFDKAPAIINPTKWITAMDHAVALSLWRYAKQDTAERTGLQGEELLKATAAFYDEVIENTQSMTDVLHRPEIQKSGNPMSEAFAMFKTDLYQMAGQLQATAGRYMADKSAENGKVLARTAYSIAMGAIWGQLMTTVFALLRYKVDRYRDDEEDELTFESWLKRTGFGLVGDLMGYVFPIFGSEVVGIFESIMYGESSDILDNISMSAVNDLASSMISLAHKLKDGEIPDGATMRKFAAKALQVFTPIPANNILRTLDAIQLHAEDIANGEFFSFNAGADNKGEKIYKAILRGDMEYVAKAKAGYKTEDAYHNAVRTALRENDPRIMGAALAQINGNPSERVRIAKLIKADGFDQDDVVAAINTQIGKLESGEEDSGTKKVKGFYTVDDFVAEAASGDMAYLAEIREDILQTAQANGKTEAEAAKSFASDVKSKAKEAYVSGALSDTTAKKLLTEYADMDEEEVSEKISYWDFLRAHPDSKLNEAQVGKYQEFAEPAEIPLEVFEQYVKGTAGLATIVDKWGDVEKSVRDQVFEVIDSLPLTWQQKDALYLAHGYAESKIWDVPW